MAKRKTRKKPLPQEVVLPRRVQLGDAAHPDWDDLYERLYVQQSYTDRRRGYVTYRTCEPKTSRLSQVGWDQIKQIIEEQEICVQVTNSCSGFSCAIMLYHDRQETFPGAVVEAEPFFSICSHVLPGDHRSIFKHGWAAFSPLFNSSENIERLKQNRLPMPKHESHYDY